MNTGINWGDVATWVTGFITLGLLIVALIQIRNERETQNKREKELEIRKERQQAEHIASWIVIEGQFYNRNNDESIHFMWVSILNQSAQPVYQVIVNLVSLPRGHDDIVQEGTESRSKGHLSIVPPGQGYTTLPYFGGGMFRHFGVEIGFKDATGKSWVRKANGDLLEINVPPIEYYHIDLPVSWAVPEKEISEDTFPDPH